MGHRLSKIYTRTGDDGTTGIAGGERIAKDSTRIEAIGGLDELNSLIGIVISLDPPDNVAALLGDIQHDLFDLGGELAMPGQQLIGTSHVDALERALDELNEGLPWLKEFILPGGNPAAAHCHLARSVCRRAERDLVRLSREHDVNPAALRYLNRLGDLLFVLCRVIARANGGKEILWQRDRHKTDG